MSPLLRFDGKVAIVTGAGAGLGRTYALLLASRGAKVVVNDLGGSPKGEGSSQRAADVVVEEIKKAGGTAVANYNSVEEGDKVVKTALDTFGRIDILINNAGILRDRSLARTSDTDWDLVHRVHLRGSFIMTRAAFPHMKKQGYGRIMMTTSVAGIYGNFGQSNYSSAKLGVVGLSNTVAIEGAKNNIHCNTVAPMGGTRMTEGILPPELFNELKPELIAPIVTWLCHEDCDETGGLYEAAGGWFGKYRWERSRGHICRNNLQDPVTVESVRDHWGHICDFTDAFHLDSNNEAAGMLAGVLEELRDGSTRGVKSDININPAHNSSLSGPLSAVGATESATKFAYEPKDAILYALGVGVSTKDENYLKYLFEGSMDFCVLPSFIIVPTQGALFAGSLFSNIKGWDMDLTKMLHGEQYIELMRPLPTSGTLSSELKVSDVLDKGSGAVVVVDVLTSDEKNNLIAKSQWSLFVVGDGNFGGPRSSNNVIPLIDPPKRNPDAVEEFKTSVDQAALYRLSGDRNPLHIDPDFASLGGFSEPILHGLCSYGAACRAVIKRFCNEDVTKFKAMKSRFARPVIPGQTLVTEMWKEGNRVFIRTVIKETGKPSLTGGYVDLVPPKEDIKSLTPFLQSCAVFEEMRKRINDDPSLATKVQAVIQWNIIKDKVLAKEWTVDLKSSPGTLYEGSPKGGIKPAVTLTLEDNDMVQLVTGKLNPQKAYMQGKLKVTGNIMLTQKLQALLKPQAKI